MDAQPSSTVIFLRQAAVDVRMTLGRKLSDRAIAAGLDKNEADVEIEAALAGVETAISVAIRRVEAAEQMFLALAATRSA
ncbi:hypothetical protein [Methylocella sp.]|uniref:hypothetical protein n=1 Tax=Methylocella sp. TaxID=1978226 RepID=UPI003783FA61